MRHIPNLITLLRLGLVPALAYCIILQEYGAAAAIFLAAALSDFVDGYVARRFEVVTRVGAFLDPVADKLNMLVATVGLAWQAQVPLWLAIAVVGREVVIVCGALAYRLVRGRLTINPTFLGKANTFIEFVVLLIALAVAAGWIPGGGWLTVLFVVVLATVLASGAHYVWLYGRSAMEVRRAR
jgi:cardiolipin synthase (CMP-forming)